MISQEERRKRQVEGGRMGAQRRWATHPPKFLSLAGLTDEQRFVIRDLTEDMRKAAKAQ